jgi:hypothetical protein
LAGAEAAALAEADGEGSAANAATLTPNTAVSRRITLFILMLINGC